MKIGTSDVSKIYFGSTEVTKVYLGTTEVYSSSVEPTPQPTTGDTLVLMHFDDSTNVAAADLATNVSVVASAQSTINSYTYKFGTGSLDSGVKSEPALTITLPDTELNTYTAECWVNGAGLGTNSMIFSNMKTLDDGTYSGFMLRAQLAKSFIDFRGDSNTSVHCYNSDSENLKDWCHVCLVKNTDGKLYVGLDGKLTEITEACTWQPIWYIGPNMTSSYTSGYLRLPIDEFRISKSNTLKDFDTTNLTYTVPTEAFTFSGESES